MFYYFLQTLGFPLIKLKHVAACLNTEGVKTKQNRIALRDWKQDECNVIDNMVLWQVGEWTKIIIIASFTVLEICILESGWMQWERRASCFLKGNDARLRKMDTGQTQQGKQELTFFSKSYQHWILSCAILDVHFILCIYSCANTIET